MDFVVINYAIFMISVFKYVQYIYDKCVQYNMSHANYFVRENKKKNRENKFI